MVNWPDKLLPEPLTHAHLQLLWKISDNKEFMHACHSYQHLWHHLQYIPVVIGSESGLCPKPVSAMTVMSTVDAEGGQTDIEGRVISVSQASLPQEETVVE